MDRLRGEVHLHHVLLRYHRLTELATSFVGVLRPALLGLQESGDGDG